MKTNLTCLLLFALLGTLTTLDGIPTNEPISNIGARFASEKSSYIDARTGYPVTILTRSEYNDSRIYHTKPQWTYDQQYIIFRSNRAGDRTQLFLVHEVNGEIIQITDTEGLLAGSAVLSRHRPVLYYLRQREEGMTFISLDLERLLADSAQGTSRLHQQSHYETILGILPEGLRNAGGFDIDARETHAYVGVDRLGHEPQLSPPEGQHWRIRQTPGGLRRLDFSTGQWDTIVDVPFKIGHVQANPWVPGEIMFCHETGGDAPQRMWIVQADGEGLRPLFVEESLDWVTHEVFVTPDEVMFNLIGHQPHLRTRPTGIAVINLRTNAVHLVGQVEENVPPGMLGEGGPGGYWHCNGSPDGRWAAGDTFNGDLYLIDRKTGRQTLLTTDHVMRPDHLHPTFSTDGTRILVQSGHFSGGRSLDLLIITIPPALR